MGYRYLGRLACAGQNIVLPYANFSISLQQALLNASSCSEHCVALQQHLCCFPICHRLVCLWLPPFYHAEQVHGLCTICSKGIDACIWIDAFLLMHLLQPGQCALFICVALLLMWFCAHCSNWLIKKSLRRGAHDVW